MNIKKVQRNELTIARKIFLATLQCTLVAGFFSLLSMFIYAQRNIQAQNEEHAYRNVSYTANQINLSVETDVTNSYAILYNDEYRNIITGRNTRLEDTPPIYKEMKTELNRIVNTSNFLKAISIIKTNGSQISTSSYSSVGVIGSYEELGNLMITDISQSDVNGDASWIAPYKDKYSNQLILNILPVYALPNKDIVSFIVLYFDERQISGLFSYYGSNSYIINDEGIIISCGDGSRLGEKYIGAGNVKKGLAEIWDKVAGGRAPSYELALPEMDARLMVTVENTDYSVNRLGSALVLSLVLGVISSLLVASVASKKLTSSIDRLKACMSEAMNDNLTERYVSYHEDEIDYLGENFNVLMDTILQKMEDIKKHEEQAALMREKILQAQINPHLL